MPRYVDSHAHLDLLEDAAGALERAGAAGVERIVAVGIDLESSRLAVSFAETQAKVYAAVGIHPNDAETTGDEAFSKLRETAASSEKVVGIGETGLDYYRDGAPREVQQDSFKHHIELASETGLPLIVHSREASADVLRILDRYARGLKVILHCFSLYEHVQTCAERGYFMSVAGNVTFPNARALRESVRAIPADLLLTETDSPYLTPVPHRGKKNEPANIPFVLGEAAKLRHADPALLAEQVHRNFISAFGLD